MRSHTDKILAMSFDLTHRYLATVSVDQSIRVWDLDTLAQLFDFQAPGELPCAIAYHPRQQCFACGFMSGCIRVFHVGTANLLAEHNQHPGQVTGLVFTPNGEFLHSAGALGNICNTVCFIKIKSAKKFNSNIQYNCHRREFRFTKG